MLRKSQIFVAFASSSPCRIGWWCQWDWRRWTCYWPGAGTGSAASFSHQSCWYCLYSPRRGCCVLNQQRSFSCCDCALDARKESQGQQEEARDEKVSKFFYFFIVLLMSLLRFSDFVFVWQILRLFSCQSRWYRWSTLCQDRVVVSCFWFNQSMGSLETWFDSSCRPAGGERESQNGHVFGQAHQKPQHTWRSTKIYRRLPQQDEGWQLRGNWVGWGWARWSCGRRGSRGFARHWAICFHSGQEERIQSQPICGCGVFWHQASTESVSFLFTLFLLIPHLLEVSYLLYWIDFNLCTCFWLVIVWFVQMVIGSHLQSESNIVDGLVALSISHKLVDIFSIQLRRASQVG